MLVEAQVSSMKTSRSGSRSSCPSNQASRRFRKSGRSCSAAWALFFERQTARIEKAPECGGPGGDAPLSPQLSLHLGQRDVILLGDQAQQECLMLVELRTLRVTLLARPRFASLPGAANPFNRCLDANPKTLRRPPCGKPFGRCGQNSVT